MFQEALTYPRDSDSAMKTIAIGGALLFLSFLVVPTVFVLGYIVRTLRAVLDGETEPPVFDNWRDLGIDGLKAFAVALGYSLVPTAIITAVVFVSVITFGPGGETLFSGVIVGLVFAAIALVTVALSLGAAYALPAALVAFARTDSVGAAFTPSELRPLLFSRTYATGWLVAFGISLLAGVVVGVLNATVIGAVLAPFVLFYAYVAGTYAVGGAVREMPAAESGGSAPDARPAA